MNNIPSCSSSVQPIINNDLEDADNNFNLPIEIIELLISHMDDATLGAFGQTSRLMRDLTSDRIRQTQITKFEDKFGALTPSERQDANLSKLYRATLATLALKNQFPTVQPGRQVFSWFTSEPPAQDLSRYLLQFDQDGAPSVTDYDVKMSQDPQLLDVGGRGSFYRAEYLHELKERLFVIFVEKQAVFDKLKSRELDSNIPLQDLRDRFARVYVLKDEMILLQKAWESTLRFHAHFCSQQSILEKAAQGSKLWLMNKVGYNTEVPTAKFSYIGAVIPFNFCSEKKHAFSTQTIHFGGQDIDVQIVGKMYESSYTNGMGPRTIISIDSGDANLGSFNFEKVWGSTNMMYSFSEYTILPRDMTVFTPEKRCAINAGDMDYLTRRPEEATGDMPIQRMLVQIAVEVFLREDFPVLSFRSNHNDGFVYNAAGFDGELSAEILQARANGRLFPEYRDLSGFTVQVLKSPEPIAVGSEGRTTRIIKQSGEPALVSFALNQEPMTWEEYLDQNGRLLGNSTAPVLPRYYRTDLEKLAAELSAGPISSSGQ